MRSAAFFCACVMVAAAGCRGPAGEPADAGAAFAAALAAGEAGRAQYLDLLTDEARAACEALDPSEWWGPLPPPRECTVARSETSGDTATVTLAAVTAEGKAATVVLGLRLERGRWRLFALGDETRLLAIAEMARVLKATAAGFPGGAAHGGAAAGEAQP
ncbi:MAG TPA: hypothetical protein DCM87_13845 [Planctomycetes bacterium]|nr:hypothetical protein [Planctomycetota bacterium]